MADKNVNQLPQAATPVLGTDLVVLSRNGIDLDQATVSEVLAAGVTTFYGTVAALVSAPAPAANGSTAITFGYWNVGDGGGNTFQWNASSTASPNGGTILQVTGVMTGRWLATIQSSATVLQFGVKCDSTSGTVGTDNTAIFAAMVTALNEMIVSGPGVAGNAYMGTIHVERSNFTIRFEGQNVIIRHPPGALANGGVLELGNTALGNSAPAYTGISLIGSVLLDGNHANTTTPGSSDLVGWGMPVTNVSYSDFGHVSAINCWNGGVGILLNSDFNVGDFYTSGNLGTAAGEPGFDINACHFNTFTFRSNGDVIGGRLLSNCWGNDIVGVVQNATNQGFNCNNGVPASNQVYDNSVRVSVLGGCANGGLVVQANCWGNRFDVTAYGLTGPAVFELGAATGLSSALPANQVPNGNKYRVVSRNGQVQSCLIAGNSGTWDINTSLDGRGGAQGSSYAVDDYGSNNTLIVNLVDSATWQVRGVVNRNGANDNELVSYNFTNTADPYNDHGGGLRNRFNRGTGLETVIASASTITIPSLGSVIPISGTATINNIAFATDVFAREITLAFQGAATVADNTSGGGNIFLSGHDNFVASVNSTLKLVSLDNVNWYEIGTRASGGSSGITNHPGLTSSQTITSGNQSYSYNLTGGTVSQALPALSGMTAFDQQIIELWKTDSSGNALTVSSTDGFLGLSSPQSVPSQGSSLRVRIDIPTMKYKVL